MDEQLSKIIKFDQAHRKTEVEPVYDNRMGWDSEVTLIGVWLLGAVVGLLFCVVV